MELLPKPQLECHNMVVIWISACPNCTNTWSFHGSKSKKSTVSHFWKLFRPNTSFIFCIIATLLKQNTQKWKKYGLPTRLAEGRPSPESSPQGTLNFCKFYGFYTFTWLFMVFLWFFMVFYGLPWLFTHSGQKNQLSQLLLYFLHKSIKPAETVDYF